jgi:DNA-binding protein HU-beta
MKKVEIVNEVAGITGKQKKDVEGVINTAIAVIMHNMEEGRNIYLRGFGSFILKKRATKVGRNIAAGTPLIIPEHYIPAFKPCKTFMNRVKNNVK